MTKALVIRFSIFFLVALVVMHLRMDISLLNPTQIDWVWQADWATHYLGWLFFRHSEWQHPPGSIARYMAPLGTSVGLTDSIPIVAYFFKSIGSWLPRDFQYFGLWYLLCLFLQGYFAHRLLCRFLVNQEAWKLLLLTLFFVTAPPLMWRNWHLALCAHWLLLWSLELHFRQQISPERRWIEGLLLLLIAASVHPYLCAMVLLVLLASLYKDTFHQESVAKARWDLGSRLAISLLLMGFVFYLNGYFMAAGSVENTGFSFYSANLLTLFHPHNLPVLLPNLPHGEGQYEGFAYLGAGVLAMLLCVLLKAPRGSLIISLKRHRCVVLVVGVSALYSLSSKITLGPFQLLELDFLYDRLGSLPNVFRASGRFVWLFYYLLLLWILVEFLKLDLSKRPWLLPFVLSVQLWDIGRIVVYPRSPDINIGRLEVETLLEPFKSLELKQMFVIDSLDSKDCFKPIANHLETWVYYALLEAAAVEGLSVNIGLASRSNLEARADQCSKLLGAVMGRHFERGALYVFRRDQGPEMSFSSSSDLLCQSTKFAQACVLK